jgi:hypothetical protein
MKKGKNPQLGPYPMPRPLTRAAGLTPLHAQLGRKWNNLLVHVAREGMVSIKEIRALVASQYLDIPVVNWAVPESWSTSSSTFKTQKVCDIKLSFMGYSASKRVHLRLEIVEYLQGGTPLLQDLIIIKQTLRI